MLLGKIALSICWMIITGMSLAIGFWVGGKVTKRLDEGLATIEVRKADQAIPVPGL